MPTENIPETILLGRIAFSHAIVVSLCWEDVMRTLHSHAQRYFKNRGENDTPHSRQAQLCTPVVTFNYDHQGKGFYIITDPSRRETVICSASEL